jgi:uncharacterized secreted protein with C-terminal beta-propeller domain
MAMRGRVAVVVASTCLLSVVLTMQANAAPKPGRLIAFGSCPDLLDYAKTHATPFVTAYGLGRPVGVAVGPKGVPGVGAAPAAGSTPQQGVGYSGTNVQESGVDEPDIVKENGDTLFTVEGGRVEAVDVRAARPELLDTLALDSGWSHELLLAGKRLLVLSRRGYWIQPLPAQPAAMIVPQPSGSTLTEVDVSDPAALKVVQTLELDGAYLDARMIGSTVRLVSSSSMPIDLPYASASGTTADALAAAAAKNRALVASSNVSAWLPTYRLGKQRARMLVSCRHVRRPPIFAGLGMLTVTTIDLARGLAPVDSTAVMTDGRIVLRLSGVPLCRDRAVVRPPAPGRSDRRSTLGKTQINAFDISDPTKTRYLGSGTVPGYLLSQWSLSEFQGVLRVVSTDAPAWWGSEPESQSYLTTLRVQDRGLVQVGQVGELGRGDRVYAVRMIGDTGYVVTFKQVDPLYTINLGDAAHPRPLGQLELPGYSSYLHPIAGNLLLGIGQSVERQANEPAGAQVSLFDVSDLKHPRRLFKATLGRGWSEAESDHHAFLYWPATGLVVLPLGQQAVAMHVSRSAGITELGRIVHDQARQSELPQIDRSVVVGKELLTVSSAGVASNALANFARLGWAAFPATGPAPKPVPFPGVPVSPRRASRWGYYASRGEVLELGISVSATTIATVLRSCGLGPAPRRIGPSWSEFLRAQAHSMLGGGLRSAMRDDGLEAPLLSQAGQRGSGRRAPVEADDERSSAAAPAAGLASHALPVRSRSVRPCVHPST